MSAQAMSLTLAGLAPALKNHLWQSTLFLLAAALLTLALRHNHARTRYWLWLAASLKFLVPFSFLVSLGSHLAIPRPVAPAPVAVYFAMEEVSQPFALSPVVAPPVLSAAHAPLNTLPILLASVWLIGFIAVLTVWFVYWKRISAAMRKATPLREGRELEMLRRLECAAGLRQGIQLLASPSSLGPGIYGIALPILIWPAAISQLLDDAHLESVLAHEICHVRRRDNLTAALHMLVEAIFWFHPLVWWLGARLEAERERACDEAVLETSLTLTTHPHIYAESILKICEFYVESPLPSVSGVTGAELKQRLIDILEKHATLNLSVAKKLLLGAAALFAIAVPILSGQAKAMQRLSLLILTPPRSVLPSFLAASEPQTSTQADNAKADTQDAATADSTTHAGFEVATVRPSVKDDGSGGWMGLKLAPSGRLVGHRETLSSLVWFAYVDKPGNGNVQGGPPWAQSEEFDINAKVEDAEVATWDKLSDRQRLDRIKPMIRSLLADRFHLKLRTEMRVTPVDVLVQAKGGAKLKAVDPPPPHADPDDGQKWASGVKVPDKAPAGGFMMTGNAWMGNTCSMSILAAEIGGNSGDDRIVVNQTGLNGYYDFTFKQSRDKDAPTFSDQLQDQLGLKLEPRKVPIKTYIIESVDKPSLDSAESPNATAPANAAQNPTTFAQYSRYASFSPGSSQASTGNASPTFEVATIRPSGPQTLDFGFYTYPGGRIVCHRCTLQYLTMVAFDIQDFKITGGPDWLTDLRFDVEAKPPASSKSIESNPSSFKNPPNQEQREMLQSLLIDRFQFRFHRSTTNASVYVLTRGDKPLKLNPPKDPNAFSWAGGVEGGAVSYATGLAGSNITMPQLATRLSGFLNRLVLDQTGIQGAFDFEYKTGNDDPDADRTAAIIASLREIGLNLREAKAPVPSIVIDHAEKPSPN